MNTVCWWSGGLTSAVAGKMAQDKFGAVQFVFIETGGHHEDTQRFKRDCEKWYGVEMETIQQGKYKDHIDCVQTLRYINSPKGAECTRTLKRYVREKWEKGKSIDTYVWGFDASEQVRADRIKVTSKLHSHYFPLLEASLTKQMCADIIVGQGIELPEMYKLGFHNNNCVGCVKGGMAYWNLIRKHFPETFDRMAKAERVVGASCLRRYYLDELPLDAGRGKPPIVASCGATGEGCLTESSRTYHGRE